MACLKVWIKRVVPFVGGGLNYQLNAKDC